MISIIIPSHNDPFLSRTVESLLQNAKGKIEIIPILDGYTSIKFVGNDTRIKVINFATNRGMRSSINAGLKMAKGKYIMKCDSHCAFGEGYDKILAENCAENWLTIPRRYSLNETTWQRDETRPLRDYHYLSLPMRTRNYGIHLSNQNWDQKTDERMNKKYDIDDTMTFQGSCWLANKNYFLKNIGKLDDQKETYGSFADEPQEIGLKYWLKGGEVKVIKKTWYAHLAKRQHHYDDKLFSRHYKLNVDTVRGHTWSAKHWLSNEEPDLIHPFSWLVEKFWPVPTWPEDRKLWVLPK